MSDLFETILAVMYPAGYSTKVNIYLNVFSYPANAFPCPPQLFPKATARFPISVTLKQQQVTKLQAIINTKSGHPAISQLVKG